MRLKNNIFMLLVMLLAMIFSMTCWAQTPNKVRYGIQFNDEGAAHSTPPSGTGELYVNTDILYFINDSGTATDLISAAGTAVDFGLTADADAGDFDIKSLDKLEFYDTAIYIDGGADGDLDIVADDAITINGAEFDVSGTTGAITINDGGDAGNISIEGTVLDINSLDFVGAGAITSAASTAITINPNTGNVAGEDLIITAHNVQLTAAGALTMSPDAAETTAITITDTEYTNALSVGDNAILGTTGIINYTNFDVDASGNLSAVNGTFTGNVSITGTFQQDAITAATAATTLTVDGTGAGGVTIGGTSTGTITMGGGATLVNLPSTVDLVLAGGDLTATDTANADMVIFTNNTLTTADLVTLSATGTRTSDNVIEIADGATNATTIGITANTQTAGNGISYTNTGAGLTGSAIYLAVTDGAGFTGNYLQGYDGAATDFKFARYGALTIAGNASADMITLTAGDVQVTAGDIDMDRGFITIDNDQDEANYIKRNYNGAGTGAALTVEDTHASSTNSTLNIVAGGSAATALKIDQTGTGNAIGIDLNVAGDLPAIDIDASAARDGDVIDILMTNMVDERAINITGAITGTAGEGVIEIHGTGVIPATASLLRLDADTAQPGDGDGYMMNIDDDTLVVATPNKYAVLIDSNANEALHVATGKSLFDEMATFTGGVDSDGDIDIDFSATTEEMNVTTAAEVGGAGYGMVTLASSVADVTVQGYLLKLQYVDDSDVDADFLALVDDSGATPDTVFTISQDGDTVTAGTLTVNGAQIVGDGATEMVGVTHDVVDAAATNPYAVTAAMSGTVFINSQAVEFDLPADPTGIELTFVVANASNLHIDPNGTDTIVHSTCAAGDRILSATVGDTVTLVGVSADAWYVKSMYPAATDFTDAD